MEYTKEQLKAAYALNLCTVSISQIIDYDDINIMEQEYEAILNNLNLEEMPKDEALLKILKQILDTITYFRIEDGDKKFLEKEYQHKMKNAIWAAVPNVGMIVAGGDPLTMAVSLASQVGIGYMNYRKEKAENDLEQEKKLWELEKTAIEQFNGLRRELFDTAWRLSSVYHFPDQLRLTERQIKQYNDILMDADLLRKYARLDAIQDSFKAYPPFWYFFGNVANEIARSDFKLSDETRRIYEEKAKNCFMKFRESNGYGLLREDEVAASCALELVDLLDVNQDQELIETLLKEAIVKSGRANDVMQLAALTYLKLNDRQEAGVLLNQLVNEQYNTVLNAQLLSSIFVYDYIERKDANVVAKYEILNEQVGGNYLYPLPSEEVKDVELLEKQFVQMQKDVLLKNYIAVGAYFMKKYMVKFGKMIPVTDKYKTYDDSYFLPDPVSIKERKFQMEKVLSSSDKDRYLEELREQELDVQLIDFLNDMFEATCFLDFMNESVQEKLSKYIEIAISQNSDTVNEIMNDLSNEQFNVFDAEKLLDLDFHKFTEKFFKHFFEEIEKYIETRSEMQDFAIAEDNLIEFCNQEKLPSPSEILRKYEAVGNAVEQVQERRFSRNLLLGEEVTKKIEVDHGDTILDIIKSRMNDIPLSNQVDFFCKGDPKIERYFRDNTKLKKDNKLMANAVAILDDKNSKGDYDLIFTNEGIVSVKRGTVKSTKLYSEIGYAPGKTNAIIIDGKFDNPEVNLNELYHMIREIVPYAEEVEEEMKGKFRGFNVINPFKK